MTNLSSLNPQQHRAVTTLDGPLLVLAGAGSGKTRVITYRISHLIDKGVSPKRILALSFTNKAAGEMRERVTQMCGRAGKSVALSTFHALGMLFLREEHAHLGLSRGFSILDEADQREAVRQGLLAEGFDPAQYDPRVMHARISHHKGRMTLPDPRREGLIVRLLERYQQRLRAMNAVDFDDLIALPVTAMEQNEAIGLRWASRFDYVMVDEYQDTNSAQLRMVHGLVRRTNNVCVVGDDDQSIYAWRGAVASNILRFDQHFRGAQIIALTQNYRSTNNILRAANAVIKNNAERHKKTLWSSLGDGDLLRYQVLDNDEDEARWIATDLLGQKARHGLKWEDFALLYRTNAQSRTLEQAIQMAKIPYRLVGGTRFYDRKEVKDIIAYLRVIANPFDEAALRRIINYPMRGIGDVSIQRIGEHASSIGQPFWRMLQAPAQVPKLTPKVQRKLQELDALFTDFRRRFNSEPFADACRALITKLDFANELVRTYRKTPRQVRKRLDDVEEVASALRGFQARNPGASLSDYLALLMLEARKEEDGDADTDVVSLMTLHSSKGLEFTAVYLAGCEEGLMPHQRVLDGDGDLSEERRLAYVGITRARRYLTLTGADRRLKFGRVQKRKPSRFVDEIPAKLFEGGRSGRVPKLTEREQKKHALNAFAQMDDILDRD